MMDFIKRQMFLLGLAVGVFVLGAIILTVTYVSYVRANSQLEAQLRSAGSRADLLLRGALYNDKVVEDLKKQADLRKTRYEDVLKLIAKMGHDRKVAVKDVFPTPKDASVLHSFKAQYDVELAGFMKRLGAVNPALPNEATAAQVKAREEEIAQAVMFAHPKFSFFRPDWVDKSEAPDIELVRYGQENLWLMSDIVDAIAKVNADFIGKQTRGVKNAAVKELIEIQIGAERAVLEGGTAPGGSTRYLTPPTGSTPSGREPTVTGRASSKGFYLVLPLRLSVIVDARALGDLVRRLKDTESFITVEGVQIDPVTETSYLRIRGLLAPEFSSYGNTGVVRLTLVAESLVFQLPEGRVTTPPDVLKAALAATKTEPGAETKPGKTVPPKGK